MKDKWFDKRFENLLLLPCLKRYILLQEYSLSGKPVTTVECENINTGICQKFKGVAEMTSTVAETGDKSFEEYILDEVNQKNNQIMHQF